MIQIAIPGRGNYELKHLVLDLNGTIALDGEIVEGVKERIQRLSELLSVSIVTADTHGSIQRLEEGIKTMIHKIEQGKEGAQKLALVQQLGESNTICIGNGNNDVSMLREAALSVCIIGEEGASTEAMLSSDVVVPDINSALELLLKPNRLVATLRK